jgi:XTP/dITP diphosphohydrolase
LEIIFATKNKGKMKEVRLLFEDTDIVPISMEEAGIDIEVVEDGETFEENAIKKAVEICKVSGKIVLSDDSGLEIDFLNKGPGVHSARFLGVDTPYSQKNQIILEKLEGVPKEKRGARFVSVIAAAFPDGRVFTTKAAMEGIINDKAIGENGFGYDPIFYYEGFKMTNAQMSLEQKNTISHRGKALKLMKGRLLGELKI